MTLDQLVVPLLFDQDDVYSVANREQERLDCRSKSRTDRGETFPAWFVEQGVGDEPVEEKIVGPGHIDQGQRRNELLDGRVVIRPDSGKMKYFMPVAGRGQELAGLFDRCRLADPVGSEHDHTFHWR